MLRYVIIVLFEFHQSKYQLNVLLCVSRDYIALNVYVALCYYKLDYFDVSQVRENYVSVKTGFCICKRIAFANTVGGHVEKNTQ